MANGASSPKTTPTIFFDYDGTLHDTMAIYGPALREACSWLRAQGHDAPAQLTDDEISCWLGWATKDMWNAFMPQLEDSIWQEASHRVGDAMRRLAAAGEARLFAGIPEMLDKLKLEGFELAILSNCRASYMEEHRRIFGLDRWFDFYYCAEDFGWIPKWQIYQQIRAQHEQNADALKASEAAPAARPFAADGRSASLPREGARLLHVMVGDRFHDREVADKGDIPFIGCSYGYGNQNELEDATILATTPREVSEALTRMLREHRQLGS